MKKVWMIYWKPFWLHSEITPISSWIFFKVTTLHVSAFSFWVIHIFKHVFHVIDNHDDLHSHVYLNYRLKYIYYSFSPLYLEEDRKNKDFQRPSAQLNSVNIDSIKSSLLLVTPLKNYDCRHNYGLEQIWYCLAIVFHNMKQLYMYIS